MSNYAEVGSSILLFFLVFGMSATVDIRSLKKAIRNRNALLTGLMLQFVILPFLGFLVVKILDMDAPMGITLLVITSSPGGSYSNWWCSIFNADLALSVCMTTLSTLLSVIMLPVNLVLYTSTSYSSDVVRSLDFAALFLSLITVIGGIATGLICSAKIHSHKFNRIANKLGNLAGIALVTFSAVVSSENHNAQVWDQSVKFYLGIMAPCLIGLIIASFLASHFKLEKPERVAVAVECCYQNTGIATSVAINMFEGDELATAVSVPLFYGIVEAVLLAFYCMGAWKAGWTKAPADESICVVIATSYEVRDAELHDPEAIEIVLGSPKEGGDGLPNDLIFSSTQEGYQIDEESLNSLTDGDTREDQEVAVMKEDNDIEEEDGEDHDADVEQPQDVVQVDASKPKGRKRGKAYSPLHIQSPTAGKPAVSPDIAEQLPHVNGDDAETVSSSGSSRLGRAVASLRSRGGANYHQALSAPEEIPDSTISMPDTDAIPAAGKSLD